MIAKVRIGWQPLALSAMALGLGGCVSSDSNIDLIGTWQRKHDGKVVEQLTFNADGTYETFNPQTGGTRESGTYSISADCKYRNMQPTGGPSYRCRIHIRGKDAFDDSQ